MVPVLLVIQPVLLKWVIKLLLLKPLKLLINRVVRRIRVRLFSFMFLFLLILVVLIPRRVGTVILLNVMLPVLLLLILIRFVLEPVRVSPVKRRPKLLAVVKLMLFGWRLAARVNFLVKKVVFGPQIVRLNFLLLLVKFLILLKGQPVVLRRKKRVPPVNPFFRLRVQLVKTVLGSIMMVIHVLLIVVVTLLLTDLAKMIIKFLLVKWLKIGCILNLFIINFRVILMVLIELVFRYGRTRVTVLVFFKLMLNRKIRVIMSVVHLFFFLLIIMFVLLKLLFAQSILNLLRTILILLLSVLAFMLELMFQKWLVPVKFFAVFLLIIIKQMIMVLLKRRIRLLLWVKIIRLRIKLLFKLLNIILIVKTLLKVLLIVLKLGPGATIFVLFVLFML